MYAGHLSKEREGEKRIVGVLLWELSQERKIQQQSKKKNKLMESRCFHPSPAEMDIIGLEGRCLKESNYLRVAGKGREGWEGRGEGGSSDLWV